eukprot:gene1964-2326_t
MEDDNRAFEAMMAELEDSDSDESDDKSRYISKAAAKKGKNVYSNNKENAPYKQYGNSATYKDERKSKEFGIVDFGQERSGPMNVNGYVPGVNSSGSPTLIQPDSNSKTMESLVAAGKIGGFIRLKNKAPEWDEQLRGHVLNFKGRVTQSSAKNFQLCSSETGDDVVMQFGAVREDRFTMDVRFPLSIYQAFCIALGCLDFKHQERSGNGIGLDIWKGLAIPSSTPRSEKKEEPNNG